MYAALVPKHVIPAASARSQSTPRSGVPGIAVVEHDRRVGREAADDEVPHHPARRREPEEPVVGLQVDVEVHLLQRLEQDPAVAVDDRLRQARRARAVEHPERMVGGHLLEGERRSLAAAPAARSQASASAQAGERRLGVEVAEHDRVLDRRQRRRAAPATTAMRSKSLPP